MSIPLQENPRVKKMKLDLAQLAVETFDTAALASDPKGTVRGFAVETELVDCTRSCPQQITCGYGCVTYLPMCLPTELEYPTCGIGPRDPCQETGW
jgi:hypothetical protein